jgi:hypothetical protein
MILILARQLVRCSGVKVVCVGGDPFSLPMRVVAYTPRVSSFRTYHYFLALRSFGVARELGLRATMVSCISARDALS